MSDFGTSSDDRSGTNSKPKPRTPEAKGAPPAHGAPLSVDPLKQLKAPQVEDSSPKTGYRPDQVLELIRAKRLEIATAFGFKGEILARCAKATSLPAEVILRVKPFEDRAKGVLGKVRVCSEAVGRLEKLLNKTVMYTDVLALAHESHLKALHGVRDHATTQRFLAAIKGTPRDAMFDRILSLVSTAHGQRCDMRTIVAVLEIGRRSGQVGKK